MVSIKRFLLCAFLAGLAIESQAVVKRPAIVPRYSGAEIGEWTMDHDTALAKAREGTNNVVVMFVGAWWCPHCQALENTVLTNAAWQAYVETNHLYLVMVDNPARNDGNWCWLRETNYYENAGLTHEQAEAAITNHYALQTSYAVPGAATQTVNGVSYQRVGYPTLIVLRPDGTRLGRFTPLTTTVSLDMVIRNMNQLLAADAWDETDDYYQGATLLETPDCEDEEQSGGVHMLSEADTADWYAFDAEAGHQWAFALRPSAAGVTNDIQVQLFDSPTRTTALAQRTMTPSDSSVLTYTVPQAGRYWVKISSVLTVKPLQGYELVYWYGMPAATVLFASPAVSVSERATSVALTVNISDTSDDGEVRVSYLTSAGSATPGQDYVETEGVLVWEAGPKKAKTISIPLLPDAVWEGDESFSVTLYAIKNCSVGEQLSTCTVVIREQTQRQSGKLGFEDASSRVLVEGAADTLFTVTRTSGADGTVSARVDCVTGRLSAPITTLVWTNAEMAAKSFGFSFTNEPGFQPDRSAVLRLTPLGGARTLSSSAAAVSLTRRDSLVVQTLSEYAADPENVALGWKVTRGLWFYGFSSDAERELQWLRSGSFNERNQASLTCQLQGPGILGFDWRLDGDGAAFQCLVGGKAAVALTNAGTRTAATLAVPSGKQTVEWTVLSGGAADAQGGLRNLNWCALPQASDPQPANKAAVINRDITLSWQDVLAGVAFPAGSAASYELYVGAKSGGQTKWAELTGTEFPRVGHAEDRAALDTLITTVQSSPFYWRVDTVVTDAQGRRAVYTGAPWSVTVLPEGSPEFVASDGGYDPTTAGGVTLPALTVGVRREFGPFALANIGEGTVGVSVKNGSLPSGMGASVRDGAVWITGVPSKVGQGSCDLHIKETTRTGGRSVTTAGTSVAVNWTVRALGKAAGQFSGYRVTDGEYDLGNAAVTVQATGRLSGRFMRDGLTFTFSASAFDGVIDGLYYAQAVAKTVNGKTTLPVTFSVDGDGADASVSADGEEDSFYMLFRNNWADASGAQLMRAYAGYYTVALPVLEKSSDAAPGGTGYLTLTVKPNGTVAYAGVLADGKNISGSTDLLYGPDCCSAEDRATFYLLSRPSGYGAKSGVYGVFFLAPAAGDSAKGTTLALADSVGLRWINEDPKSVTGYDPTTGELPNGISGFANMLDVTGGYYDKTVNLQTYYGSRTLDIQSTFKAPDDFDGAEGDSGFTLASVPDPAKLPATPAGASALAFPGSSVVKVGSLVDFDASTNPWEMALTPNRATGIFAASFKFFYEGLSGSGVLQQKARKVTVKGVFLPVQPAYLSYGDWLGFYLVPDAHTYLNANGRTTNYPFSWSYGFSLVPVEAGD